MSDESVRFLEEHKRVDKPYLGAFANGYGDFLIFDKTPRSTETVESWITLIDGIIGRANADRS